ncbi:DsbA family oxidoreductase [Rhodococcus sp. 14-2483-1-1]|uniref:DsbA family oxidoreductase n=1 Tax=Rhodococcus sp. 14-2483-1-1 TaxID=2023148 RepID=UPI0014822F76|nr:DsbA family oxidoreductase [Rhodococcus sp. 14-2483-1-1]
MTTTITMWADVRCPWCWIGHRQLGRALDQLGPDTKVEYRSLLLEPDGPAQPGMTVRDAALTSWGFDAARWAAQRNRIVQGGAAETLTIDIDTSLTVDSRAAHRLLKLVAARRLNRFVAWDALYSSHFERNEDIGDWIVLRSIGLRVGLADDGITRLEESDEYSSDVDDDLRRAADLGISSVPTVMVDSVRATGDLSLSVPRLANGPVVDR